jgi:hypothetical protein
VHFNGRDKEGWLVRGERDHCRSVRLSRGVWHSTLGLIEGKGRRGDVSLDSIVPRPSLHGEKTGAKRLMSTSAICG